MSRKVRMVPPDWKHPEGKSLDEDFSKRIADWSTEHAQWERGFVRDWANDGWKPRDQIDSETFEDWYGSKPIMEEYMPEWPAEVATHYMMYETTSEGTPISPAFATPEELARWLADNGASSFGDMTATYEQWLAMINRGSSVASMVMEGNKMISGVAAVSEPTP